jgi:dTDP-4-amino-4,6-dideoxygalactose transaminase
MRRPRRRGSLAELQMNQHARLDTAPIPFIDLAAQRRRLGNSVDEAVARVLTHCQFVMGPEVRELEAQLAKFCGARHAISCSSGTDALILVLMAKGIGPGDAVVCPSFTFCATAEAVAFLGATPVYAEVSETTFNIDAESARRAIATARKNGLKPKAIIPVDLFGLPADFEPILELAASEGLFVLDDAAQAFGATYKGRPLGIFGLATATSFFPAKPLGCYGDGGAIVTDDDTLAETIKSLRVHGHGTDKYDNVRIGMTGRLDTIQAAVAVSASVLSCSIPRQTAAKSSGRLVMMPIFGWAVRPASSPVIDSSSNSFSPGRMPLN